MCVAAKIAKTVLKLPILGFKVVQGHRCWYDGKLVSNDCYDKQQICAHVQPLSR